MKRFTRLIEGMFVPVIAVICLLISLADFFGLFNLIPKDRIPLLTLLLVSLVLSSLSFVHSRHAEAQQDVQRLLAKIDTNYMGKVLHQIDPRLRKVLKDDYFIDILEFFQIAVEESKVQLNDAARFRFYFIHTLQSYPKSTFLSTASFLWKDPAIEEVIAQFIKNGGKLEQILFVKDAEEISSSAFQALLARQQRLGANIQVHIVNAAATPGDLKKNFVVESKGKIAWDLHVDEDGHIESSIIIANKHSTAGFCRIFEKLRESKIRQEKQDLKGV